MTVPKKNKSLAEQIEAVLPQTQCGLCEYVGCKPYAQALAADASVGIDRCLPGGVETLQQIAGLVQKESTPFEAGMRAKMKSPEVAWIDPEQCIGCTKCIQACPVDAIIGSYKAMHAVIDLDCTGCGLCLDPCPVDCIQMQPLETDKNRALRPYFKSLYEAKNQRKIDRQAASKQHYQSHKMSTTNRRAMIQQALEASKEASAVD